VFFDPGHFVDRFFSPFNGESRFYWPAVYAVLLAFVTNIVWYNWRRRGVVSPAENTLKSWAFWTNCFFYVLLLVWIGAKVQFWLIALTVVANLAAVTFLYWYVLPPQEAAWERERRRPQYFPQAARRKKRRAARR